MKFLKFFVLLCAICLAGCGSADSGKVGDQNDPAAPGGTDEAAMQEETGDVQ